MDNNQYLGIFIDEANEHVQTMNQELIELEKDPNNQATLDSLFRVAHTLKGMSATMGYQEVANYTHKLENVLDSLRRGTQSVTSEVVDLLLEGADALEAFILSLSEGKELKFDFEEMQKRLEDTFNNLDNGQEPKNEPEAEKALQLNLNEYEHSVLQEAIADGYRAFDILVEFDENVVLKGARAFMVFQEVEGQGEIIKSNPDVESIEDENFDFQFELTVVTQVDRSVIEEKIQNISEIKKVTITPITISSNDHTENNREIDESSKEIATSQAPDQDTNTGEPMEQDVSKPKTGKTVRVDIERLDKLMNLISELVINKTRLEQVAASKEEVQDLVKTSEQFSRITSEIQNVVMTVRMVPLEQVFNRFPRMVRDLSKSLGKQVELTIEGEETELDRSLIDEIGDPLMHLIRNAIDHGLEDQNKRKQLGKPEQGNVHLKAYHNENNVVIEVTDDGGGIDPEKIREKVINKGLITEKDSQKICDSDVIDYLFTSGFSTADEVSDVSGRGVGLDVVKSKIEGLGGRLELDSELNQGSKFTMYLPLTLAIIQALMVKIREEQYAVPLSAIEETTIQNASDIEQVRGQEVIKLRDQLIPIVDLHSLLGTPKLEQEHDERFIIIVKKGEKKAGLVVDELIGQQEVVIKTLGYYLADLKGFTGATILGDGKVALILDVNSLIF